MCDSSLPMNYVVILGMPAGWLDVGQDLEKLILLTGAICAREVWPF
jgi:hypothetical protein